MRDNRCRILNSGYSRSIGGYLAFLLSLTHGGARESRHVPKLSQKDRISFVCDRFIHSNESRLMIRKRTGVKARNVKVVPIFHKIAIAKPKGLPKAMYSGMYFLKSVYPKNSDPEFISSVDDCHQ